MKAKLFIGPALVVLALLVSIAMLSGCGGPEGQDREFDLTFEHAGLEPTVVKVDHRDNVTLRIDSDEYGTFHLHGYDIELHLDPDDTATMEFKANATGRFKITFHRAEETHEEGGDEIEHGEEDEHTEEEKEIASLEVLPR